MKHFYKTILTLFCLAMGTNAMAQYQLLNPGFENWEGSGNSNRPSNWSSFPQSDGSWAWAASTAQHHHRYGGRPGTDGTSYVTIYSRSVLGVVANGNMTTGQVHAGSTTASSSNNYNYTHRGSNYCHTFTGTPDSMYVWVSYYTANAAAQGSVRAYLHGDSDFKDPNDCGNASLYKGAAVAEFSRTTSSNTTPVWEQQRVPFTYTGTSAVNYILMSMTTNTLAGSGNANDSLSIDDIEFIYSAWLDSLSVNGNAIADFRRDSFDYVFECATMMDFENAHIEFTTQADDAIATLDSMMVGDFARAYTLFIMAEDSVTTRTYHLTINFTPSCDTVSNLSATVIDNNASITWAPVNGSMTYEVEYWQTGENDSTTINTTSPAIVLTLDYEQQYEVRVRAQCYENVYSDFCEPIVIVTEAEPVYECPSADTIMMTEVSHNSCTLVIEHNDTAEYIYEILLTLSNDTITDTLISETRTASFLNLVPEATYVMMVRTVCENDNYSNWLITTFTTLPDPNAVGIETPSSKQFSLSPNPTTHSLEIASDNRYNHIDIYNQQGQRVMSVNENAQKITVEQLPAGIYTLVAVGENGEKSAQRFVKQ